MFLTAENYYSLEADKYYLSVSQYKNFITCEAKTLAQLKGEYISQPSDAMLVGSYVDAWCEGTLDKFKEEHPEIYRYQNKGKGLLAKFSIAEDCIKAIQDDINLSTYLTGQKQVIFTADLFGVPWKIKMDNYNPEVGFFSDLKVMANLYDKFWNKELQVYESFIEHYKYNFQMCVYAMIEKLATGREDFLEPYLVVVTKQQPCDKAIYNGFLSDMQAVMWHIEEHLPRIMALKEGREEPIPCGKCEYCRSVKTAEIMDHHYLLG